MLNSLLVFIITLLLSFSVHAGVIEYNFQGVADNPYYQCQAIVETPGVSRLNFLEFSILGPNILVYMGFQGPVHSIIDDQTLRLENNPFVEIIGPTLALRVARVSKDMKNTMEKLQTVDKDLKSISENQTLYLTDLMPFIQKHMVTFRVKNAYNDMNNKTIEGLNPLSALNKVQINTRHNILISFPSKELNKHPKTLLGELRMQYEFLSQATIGMDEAFGYKRNFYKISCERMSSATKREILNSSVTSGRNIEFYKKNPDKNTSQSGDILPFPRPKNDPAVEFNSDEEVISRTELFESGQKFTDNLSDLKEIQDFWQSTDNQQKPLLIKNQMELIIAVAGASALLVSKAKAFKHTLRSIPILSSIILLSNAFAVEKISKPCVGHNLYSNLNALSVEDLQLCLRSSKKMTIELGAFIVSNNFN